MTDDAGRGHARDASGTPTGSSSRSHTTLTLAPASLNGNTMPWWFQLLRMTAASSAESSRPRTGEWMVVVSVVVAGEGRSKRMVMSLWGGDEG